VRGPVRVVHLGDVCTLHDEFEIVFLAFKAYDTAWACHFIEPYLAPNGLLVGTQNAMTADLIAEIFGPDRTLGGVVELGSQVSEPGVVLRNTERAKSWFGVGSLGGSTAGREEKITELLGNVGRAEVVPDVLSVKWMKLTVNAMMLAPVAMLGLANNEAVEVPGMREVMLRLGREAMEAGESLGYSTVPIKGLGPEDLVDRESVPEVLLDEMHAALRPGGHNTVLMDHLNGRRSEAALTNGLVAEELARRGAEATVNAAIGEIETAVTNLDLIQV